MQKIIPLVALHEIDNYLSNGVDSVLMGTNFGSKAQVIVYDLEEIIESNKKIPVIALFNRDFMHHELPQMLHEIKVLNEGGIDQVIITDEAVIKPIEEMNLDLKIIFRADDSLNHEAISDILKQGVHEVLLTQVEMNLPELESGKLGIHFFGKKFTHTHHEDAHFHVEDMHGKHHYSHDVYSLIHAYQTLVEKEVSALYFESFGLDIDDVLFVIRTVGLVEDHLAFENLVYDTMSIDHE